VVFWRSGAVLGVKVDEEVSNRYAGGDIWVIRHETVVGCVQGVNFYRTSWISSRSQDTALEAVFRLGSHCIFPSTISEWSNRRLDRNLRRHRFPECTSRLQLSNRQIREAICCNHKLLQDARLIPSIPRSPRSLSLLQARHARL
jgi:hypothetical protein